MKNTMLPYKLASMLPASDFTNDVLGYTIRDVHI